MLIKRLLHRWVLMNEAGGADAGGAGGGAPAGASGVGSVSASGADASSGSAGGGATGSVPAAGANGDAASTAATGQAAGTTDAGLNPPASLIGEEAPAGEQKPEGTEAPADDKPIEYADFKLPEGVEANAETMAAFKEAAASAKLSQEQAQAFVDLHQQAIDKAATAPYELWRDTQKAWQDEIKADPEFGGAKLESETLPNIARAISAFSPDPAAAASLRKAFSFTGAGNNPDMIRFMARVGKSLAEGSHVSGTPTSGDGGKSAAQKLYPTTGNGQS